MQEQLQSQYTNVDGIVVHARVAAKQHTEDRPVLILVHGLVISSRYMVPLAKLLAPYYRVYAIDLPGYGKSDKPDHTLELPELADALRDWMDAVQINHATLLGNSFGCQIIAEFAVRHPDRVNRIILQAPTVDRHTRTFPQQLWRFLCDAPNEDLFMAFLLLYDYSLAGIPRLIRTIQISLADAIETKLPLIQVPTLVVIGTKDTMVPEYWAREVANLLPEGKLVIVDGVGHAFNYSVPMELARVTQAFLNSSTPDLVRTQ
ncbi:MAG: alpha/beta hydrolase [Elainellaceae cyanobacterium]